MFLSKKGLLTFPGVLLTITNLVVFVMASFLCGSINVYKVSNLFAFDFVSWTFAF